LFVLVLFEKLVIFTLSLRIKVIIVE
jgi:hypothetical protein